MLTVTETPGAPPVRRRGRRDLFALPQKEKLRISVVIITYNESRNIRRTLSRLWWCDEIVIVDSCSTDDTVAICREYGCRVFLRPFEGYGSQKQYAVAMAKNDWILNLDADEVLSDRLIFEIGLEFLGTPKYTGYELPMNLVFLGREFHRGRESGRCFLRLFRKSMGKFNDAKVHERVEITGPVYRLRNSLLHYSYDDLEQWYAKMNRYSTLGAEEAVKRGKNKSVLALLFSLPYYFFRYYLLERNFLNGLEGYYWAVLNANYHFTKYAKIRKLHSKAARVAVPQPVHERPARCAYGE